MWSGIVTVQVEHPDDIFEWDLLNQGKYLLFIDSVKKQLTYGMHLDFFEVIASNLLHG